MENVSESVQDTLARTDEPNLDSNGRKLIKAALKETGTITYHTRSERYETLLCQVLHRL